ncbi:MAG: DNA integrity scanning protein DisA nucleotide-binding domain protein [Trueperaceae bacterium]|nr:DNA integrity scanning protein DisA nucleotide-binding domain protein [Trueperaceae bacterium]
MAHTIDQFMWGFQSHFRISAGVRAKSLFTVLDPALDPAVLLVGRLETDRKDRHPLCVDPEDGDILVDALTELERHVEAAIADDPESGMLQSHPRAEGYRRDRVAGNGFANGVARALNESRPVRRFFASFPQRVDDYLVTAVVHVDRAAYDRHLALAHAEYLHRFTVATSLLDAAVRGFLGDCSGALRDPDAGEARFPDRPVQDALREAGRALMDNPGFRLGEVAGHPQLFDAFCEVAALRYEGAEGHGQLLVTGEDRAGADVVLSFREVVPMRKRRAVRKVLEMASEELSALATPQGIYGLGRVDGNHDPSAEDVFAVVFLGRNAWELRHAGRPLMRVQDGVPALPREPLSRASLEFAVRRVFGDNSDADVERLWEAMTVAREQRHGTLLVVSSGADTEAQRLAGQCTAVEPAPLTRDLVESITAIDGAVLVDPHGVCHAIGVILDGMAVTGGDSGRGSRYNSALRYLETARSEFDHKALALVVSEDGMVDLLPTLRPPMRRSEVEARVGTLRRLASEDRPSRTIFTRTEEWLREHCFYLDGSTCDEVNRLVDQIDTAWREKDEGAIRIIRTPLAPHGDFDPAYLLDG